MNRGAYGRTPWGLILVAGVLAAAVGVYGLVLVAAGGPRSAPPPPCGYLGLRPVGSYGQLPDDAGAAAEVQHSTWEVRPGNKRYDEVMPGHLSLQPIDAADNA